MYDKLSSIKPRQTGSKDMHDLATLRKMFDQFHEAIYIVDTERRILYFNPIAVELSGFSCEEMEHSFCYDNKLNHIDEQGNRLCLAGCPLVESIKFDRTEDHSVYMQHKKGHRVGVHVRTIPHHDLSGAVDGVIEVFSQISNQNLILEELKIREALAYIDPVTNTFNRHYLKYVCNEVLGAHKHKVLGVIFLDIDNFKHFNDDYGHDVGDEVLLGVSKSISLNLPNQDILIRYGGDEFIIILFGDTKEEIIATSNKIGVLLVATTIRHDKQEFRVQSSLGLSFRIENEKLNNVITRADQAMYNAKRARNNKVVIL